MCISKDRKGDSVFESMGPGHSISVTEKGVDIVLVWTGIALVFFLLSGTELCF